MFKRVTEEITYDEYRSIKAQIDERKALGYSDADIVDTVSANPYKVKAILDGNAHDMGNARCVWLLIMHMKVRRDDQAGDAMRRKLGRALLPNQ